jgi:hypothetical protein
MTKTEFKIAKNHQYSVNNTFCREAEIALNGLYVDKYKRIATKEQAAYILNYQCLYLNGEYDMQELNNMRYAYCKYVDLLN